MADCRLGMSLPLGQSQELVIWTEYNAHILGLHMLTISLAISSVEFHRTLSHFVPISRNYRHPIILECRLALKTHTSTYFMLFAPCQSTLLSPQVQEQHCWPSVWQMCPRFLWLPQLQTMWLQWGRNWDRCVWLLHRTLFMQGGSSSPSAPLILFVNEFIYQFPLKTSLLNQWCVVTLRKMWKALAVTSANWERSIWTPLTLKAAPSASALEPLTVATALTNGGVRYCPKDKELLFNK